MRVKNVPWMGTAFYVGGDTIYEARQMSGRDGQIPRPVGLTRSAVKKTENPAPGSADCETKCRVRVFWAVRDWLTGEEPQHGGETSVANGDHLVRG
jgi:hypothetical protein